jgi:hypothetical protein
MMKKTTWIAAAVLATLSGAGAAQSHPTLNDARKAVRESTTEGVVIIPARKKAQAPAPAASGASAPVASSSVLREVARDVPPPSGRSIGSARRLDAPDLGIALPSRGASAPR